MNIIITGAGKGVGFALTRTFLKMDGHRVFALSRNISSLESLSAEQGIGGKLFYSSFDLLSGDYEKLILDIKNKLGSVDVLVNNAGFMVNKPVARIDDADFARVFDVNVKSPFRLVKKLLPHFSKPAHIINITSMGGVQGSMKFPGLSVYSASKGALNVLTECLAEELKDSEIKVNALALGAVQTEMLSEAFPGYKAPIQPDEMAEFIADFALTGNRFFNGKIIPVSISTP